MKKSLTLLCAMSLLAPLSLAIGAKDMQLSLNLGNRVVTIGDRTGSKINLLGDRKTTSSVTAAATTIALEHSTPTFILEASTLVPFGKGHGIKIALEAQAASSDSHKLYDGVSSVATIAFEGHGAGLDDGTGNTGGAGSISPNFGVTSITGGSRVATVDHQTAFGAKILYAFGEDNRGAGLGLSMLWTKDEYKYTAQENPTAGVGVGVYDATFAGRANNFVLPAAAVVDAAAAQGTATTATDPVTRLDYTPAAGVTEKYDDRMFWYGAVAEGSTEISDSLCFKGGLAYYMRQFEVSKTATSTTALSAPFVVTATDAKMYIGHVGLTIKSANS